MTVPTTPAGFQQAVLGHDITVVCDGWTEPRHPRVVIKQGNPRVISHGMCAECQRALDEEMNRRVES